MPFVVQVLLVEHDPGWLNLVGQTRRLVVCGVDAGEKVARCDL